MIMIQHRLIHAIHVAAARSRRALNAQRLRDHLEVRLQGSSGKSMGEIHGLNQKEMGEEMGFIMIFPFFV